MHTPLPSFCQPFNAHTPWAGKGASGGAGDDGASGGGGDGSGGGGDGSGGGGDGSGGGGDGGGEDTTAGTQVMVPWPWLGAETLRPSSVCHMNEVVLS